MWWVCTLSNFKINPMRTTSRLVKINIVSFIEPIREGVRKNSLICKFLMLHFQSRIMIGLTNEHFMIRTNQNSHWKAGSAQGVKCDVTCSRRRISGEKPWSACSLYMKSQQNMKTCVWWLLAVKYISTGSDIMSNLTIGQSVVWFVILYLFVCFLKD